METKTLEYSYEIIDEYKIIKVTVLGNLTTQEAAIMGIMVRVKANEMGYKLFFDYTLLSSIKIAIGDAYFWFSDHYDTINTKLRHIPTALLVNEKDKSSFDFFENTCYNKGIRIRIFRENKNALEWLNQIKN